MSATAPPVAPAEAPQPAPAPAPVRGRNIVGIVAFAVALFAFLLAVIPPTSFIAWLPAVAAIVLGIVGLTRKNQGKGFALTGLLVGVVAWIVAIIVATASAFLAVGAAIDEVDNAPTIGTEVEAEEPAEAPVEAGIGDTVVNDDGVEFTVTGMECGLATAGDGFFEETAKGQFCKLTLTLVNGSSEELNVSGINFTGYIGEAEYEVSTIVSTFDDESVSTDINPGLSADGIIFIDIPADAALEYIEFAPLFSFTEGLVVKVS